MLISEMIHCEFGSKSQSPVKGQGIHETKQNHFEPKFKKLYVTMNTIHTLGVFSNSSCNDVCGTSGTIYR